MRITALLIITLTTSLLSYGQSGISGSVVIDDNSPVTNNQEKKVSLGIRAEGAREMMLSNNGSYLGAKWERYEARKPNWRLEGEDGIKTVYAKFRDSDGNVSETVTATIELDRQPPQNPEIIVNGGMRFTNNRARTVMLELNAEEATMMRVSNRPDFLSTPWVAYNSQIKGWKLDPREGLKTIYAQFKDNAGNTTEVVTGEIHLDVTAPQNCRVIINDNAKYASSNVVKLTLLADGASEMIIRGGEGWIPYQRELEWELPEGDGRKDVFVKFRDEVGNQSSVASAFIELDTKPPSNGMITINDGSRYTRRHTDVSLKILSTGVREMMLSLDSTFKGASWQPYTQHISSYPIKDEDGRQTVYVRFRDEAKNVSPIFQASITLDKTPPTRPFIKIISKESVYDSLNNRSIVKNEGKSVDLQLSCEGANYMMISNMSSFYGAKWERYRPKLENWELGGYNDGARSVFVKFRDRAGNESAVASDNAEIDTQPPVDCRVIINNGAEYLTHPEKIAELTLFARGADFMIISEDPTFEGAEWEPYQKQKTYQFKGNDGIKTIVAKFKDYAGNEANHVVDEIILDRKPPFDTEIVLDKGRGETRHPDKVVLAAVKAKDAVLMQISNVPDFKGSRWQGFTNMNFTWVLAGDDGNKTVYARFQDKAGNISEPVTDEILLDRTPPKEGKVVINEGERITNNANKMVTLTLEAEEAAEMRIGNRFDFVEPDGTQAQWMPFATSKEWRLIGPDGVKFVYVQFRDAIGNISKTAYAQIGVDRTAPKEGRITINRGDKFCTDVSGYVSLILSAKEATQMMISNNPNFQGGNWIKFESYYPNWILDTQEDGLKNVYVKFRDNAGNETTPVTASITLDRQEPVGVSLMLNNGAEFSNDPSMVVNLEIEAEGAKEMIISNSPQFHSGRWEPYQTVKQWTLFGRDGLKTVYVKFRDEAGNESAVISSNIKLDTQAPIPMYVKINDGKTLTESSRVSLSIKAKDANFMMVSNDPRFDGAIWEEYSERRDWDLTDGEGLKRVFVKFKDDANNESSHKFADITLVPKF